MMTKSISALLAVMFLVSVATVSATEVGNSSPSVGDKSSPKLTLAATPSPAALACVQTAVQKRDGAIISAFGAFSTSVTSALTARMNALNTAWGISDKTARRAAIKKAWSDFSTATKAARKTLNQARLAAWKQYAKDVRACKSQGAPTGDDSGSQGLESSL